MNEKSQIHVLSLKESTYSPVPLNNIIKHRLRKIAMVLAGLFLVGLLVVHFLLNYQIDRVIGRTVRTVVDYRSNGVYSLTYRKININLLRNSIEIKNLVIKGDTQKYKQRKSYHLVKNSLFDIRIPQVEIKGLNIWKLLFYEKLEIENFYLHKPQVKLLDYPNKKRREERLKINNLYHFFSDYLRLFRIEHLEVSNGSFFLANPQNIREQVGRIDSISVVATQIKIDSTNQPQYSQKPFEVADIELRIKRNTLQIPENQLEISMGELWVSTKKAIVTLANLQVKHHSGDIKLPLLRLSGIDIHKLYFSKELIINKLWLKNPSIHVLKNVANPAKQISPYTLISNYLASLTVEHILVENGNFDLSLKNIPPFKNASFLFTHFYLDSLTEKQRAKHFFCDNFAGKIQNYELLLPDSLHFAKVKELKFSTAQSMIYAKDVVVDIALSKQGLPLPYHDISKWIIPYISLESKDLWKNLADKSPNFEELKMKSPQIYVYKRLANPKIEGLVAANREFPLNIKKISIENAMIHYHQWQKTNNEHRLDKIFHCLAFSAQVYDLRLEEEKYFDHLTIDASSLFFNLAERRQTFQIDNFSFSSLNKKLFINNLQSLPPLFSSQESMNGKFSALTLENFDIHQLYQDKILKAGRLTIHQPSLQLITSLDSLVKEEVGFLKSIEFEEVSLINGKVNWQQNHPKGLRSAFVSDGISAKLKEISIQLDKPNKSKSAGQLEEKKINWGLVDAEVILQNYAFTFPDGSHTVKVGKVDLNYGKSTVQLAQVNLSSTIAKRTNKNIYQAEIPLIELKIKDLKNINHRKDWEVAHLKVIKPKIDLYLIGTENPKSVEEKQLLILTDLLAKMPFNKLSVNDLKIDSGLVMLTYKQANRQTHHLALNNLSLHLNHFEIDSAKHDWNQLFDLKHINFNLGQYSHRLPDNIHQIMADNIRLLSSDSSLLVHNFAIKPIRKVGIPYSIEAQDRANVIDIYTPKLYFQGWDMASFLAVRKVILSRLVIETPQFNMQIHRPDSTQKLKNFTQKLYSENLYKLVSPFIKELKIADFLLNDGHLNLMTYRQNNINTFTLDSVSIHARKFDIHPTASYLALDSEDNKTLPAPFVFDPKPYRFLNTENIDIRIKNYTFQLPDKEHILKAKSIFLSTKDSILTADKVLFMPILDKVTFSEKQTYKKAWLYPQIQKLSINQFDFYSLLHHQELKMRSVYLDSVKFEIYRDRSLPSRTDYFPPMPQDLLKELPFFVKIDSIKLKNGNIIYEEKLATKAQAGRLTFENTEAIFLNITNQPDSLKKQSFQSVLAGTTYIMGQGKFDIEARFFLNDPKNLHTLKGELGEMPMTSFNAMLEYVFPVRIKSGIIKGGKFDLKLNDRTSKGKMWLRYNNLKVEVINRKFASFVANSFVVTNHNPSRTFAPIRTGEMKSRRNPSRSIFSYWGYSVLNGFKTSIGLRGKKQQKKSKFDKNKKPKNKKLKLRKKKEAEPKKQTS